MNKYVALIIIALFLAFFQGVANLIGLASLQYQLIIDITVLVLFFYAFSYRIKSSGKVVSLGLGIFLLLTTVFIASALINQSDLFTSFRMYRNTFIPFLLFFCVLNLPLKESHLLKINKFIFFMLIVQIVAAVLKFMAWGVREGGIIGTFSSSAGQMSTIFPLLAIIFLLILYFVYDRKNLYLFMIIGFVFMSWGGGKRAIVFVLPIFMLVTYMMYRKLEFSQPIFTLKNIVGSSALIIILIPVFYLAAIYTPTLNPERAYGGSFDLEHITDYAATYHIDGRYHVGDRYGAPVLHGRVATLIHSWELINEDYPKLYIGYGPSSIYATSRGDDNLINFGVTSFQTGLATYLMSIGILGTFILMLLYIKCGYDCFNIYRQLNPYWRAISLGIVISVLVFIFDFINYSPVFVHGLIPAMLFFYLSAATIKIVKNVR